MTALHEFCEKLCCEGETSDEKRSILLLDKMNAFGFSKTEPEIHRHEDIVPGNTSIVCVDYFKNIK